MSLPEHTDELYAGLSEAPLVVPLPLVLYQMRKAGQGPILTSTAAAAAAAAAAPGTPPGDADYSEDVRMAQIVSFAAQRFLATVLNDAMQEHKRRDLATSAIARSKEGAPQDPHEGRRVLHTNDLAHALSEYGIQVTQPPYYVDSKADAAQGPKPQERR